MFDSILNLLLFNFSGVKNLVSSVYEDVWMTTCPKFASLKFLWSQEFDLVSILGHMDDHMILVLMKLMILTSTLVQTSYNKFYPYTT